jgi:hypothetical protein
VSGKYVKHCKHIAHSEDQQGAREEDAHAYGQFLEMPVKAMDGVVVAHFVPSLWPGALHLTTHLPESQPGLA